jgi:putative ABC transport system permease protein
MLFIQSVLRDARHGARLWIGAPGLTAAMLASLTLSVGAATAVFTFVDVLLLRPLPVRAPEELFAVGPVRDANLNLNPLYFSLEFYRHVTETDPVFRDLFASSVVASSGVHFSGAGPAERLRAELVSGNYFRVLGVAAKIGRTIVEDDERPGTAHPVAVLSDAAWRRLLNGRADAVGQEIRLNGFPYTVVGVMDEEFFGTRAGYTVDLWVPLGMTSQMAGDRGPSRNSNYIELTLRIAQRSQAAALQSTLETAYLDWNFGQPKPAPETTTTRRQPALRLVRAPSGLSLLRGQYAQPLVILLSAVAVLLLIACANVANLLLARALARRRELAIRLSQGATRLQIVQQLVTECLVLTLAAGVLGWCSGVIMGRGLLSFLPSGASTSQFAPSGRAFLFTTLVMTVAGVVFGLLPSPIALRLDLNQALRKDTTDARLRFRHLDGQSVLSALQLALSLVLVIGMVLFARSLHNLRAVDSAFQHEHVLLAALDPVKNGYSEQRVRAFYDTLLTRVRSQPGVLAAGLASHGSLSGVLPAGTRFVNTAMHAAGQASRPGVDPTVYMNDVSPGYFEAVGTPVRGRDFTAQDASTTAKVGIINETAARYFFGDTDPLGQRIGSGGTGPADIEVIGVVRDAKYLNRREEPRRVLYRPHTRDSLMTLHVRAAGDPAALSAAVQREVRALDPSMPVFNLQTMKGRIDESLRQERLVTTLASALSVLGTMLAIVGVYGVLNYGVTRRRRELAIRIAVGASPARVVSSIIRKSLVIAAAGLALGIPAALTSMAAYRTFLFGVSGSAPVIVAIASAGLALFAIGAGYVPARRAVRIEPIAALRED